MRALLEIHDKNSVPKPLHSLTVQTHLEKVKNREVKSTEDGKSKAEEQIVTVGQ